MNQQNRKIKEETYFELIKTYPGSQPLGWRVKFWDKKFLWWRDDEDNHVEKIINETTKVSYEDCESNPEFWKKIRTKPICDEDYIEDLFWLISRLNKRLEQLEKEVQNLKINPPQPYSPPNQWPNIPTWPTQPYCEGTYVTTITNKTEINE